MSLNGLMDFQMTLQLSFQHLGSSSSFFARCHAKKHAGARFGGIFCGVKMSMHFGILTSFSVVNVPDVDH